jgi:ribosomal protein S18 acetylase RimI-like enzyme
MESGQDRGRLSFNRAATKRMILLYEVETMAAEMTGSIVRLYQADDGVAAKIKALHDAAYAVEAQLLGLENFPPLKRTLESYAASNSIFFGYMHKGRCVGSVELETAALAVLEVSSLVVDPKFARRGVATKLMTHALSEAGTRRLTVSTAGANYPAINLYKGLGFRAVDQWVSEDGIEIVQLAK